MTKKQNKVKEHEEKYFHISKKILYLFAVFYLPIYYIIILSLVIVDTLLKICVVFLSIVLFPLFSIFDKEALTAFTHHLNFDIKYITKDFSLFIWLKDEKK